MNGVEGAPSSPGHKLRWYGQLAGTTHQYKRPGYAADVLADNLDGTFGGEMWIARERVEGTHPIEFRYRAYVDGYRVQWNPTVVASAPPKLVGPGIELIETSLVHVDDMDAHKAAGGGWIEKP